MKTMSLIVILILSLAPLGSAWANPISQAEPNSGAELSALALSLTGEPKLHPAQLSIPGFLVEDVLQPKSLIQAVLADQNSPLACR